MIRYLLRQLLGLISLLFLVSLAAFFIIRVMPGNPAEAYLNSINAPLTEESIRQAKEEMGLEGPVTEQYARWLGRALKGDLGNSYETRRPVAKELARGLRYTACLAGASLLWIFSLSVPLGLLSVKYANRPLDSIIGAFTFLGSAMPKFWLGFLLVMFFSLRLEIFPVQGAGSLKAFILPSFTLAWSYIATYTTLLRNSILDVLSRPFVSYARIRGFGKWRVMLRHVLPNALTPVLTTLGLQLGGLLSGTVIVENVFSCPGLGRMCIRAVAARDYPVIQGYILLMAVIFGAANLTLDLACGAINPGLRMGKEE